MKLLFAILLFSASLSAQTIAIRAGVTTPYTDSTGQVWAADSGSTCLSTIPGGTDSVTSAIAGALPAATDQVLYQSERYGSCTYTFTVANGSYNVLLKFAEIYFNAAGQRLFNVAINGTSVLSAFDIFASAGGEFKAIDKTFPVTVTGGSMAIQFTVGAANYPKISAIEIMPASAPPPPPPPPTVTTPTGVTTLPNAYGPGTITITGTLNGVAVSQSFDMTPPVIFQLTSHAVSLQWTDSGSGITSYNIFRSQTSGVFGATPIGTSTTTTYADTTVAAGQTYYYAVQAVAGTSTSALSSQVSATIPTP